MNRGLPLVGSIRILRTKSRVDDFDEATGGFNGLGRLFPRDCCPGRGAIIGCSLQFARLDQKAGERGIHGWFRMSDTGEFRTKIAMRFRDMSGAVEQQSLGRAIGCKISLTGGNVINSHAQDSGRIRKPLA